MIKDVLGYCAAAALVTTLIPQLYFTFKRKKANDISYGFLTMQVLTCFLFLTYGILLNEAPLIIANTLVLCQSFSLFFMKFYYSRNTSNSQLSTPH